MKNAPHIKSAPKVLKEFYSLLIPQGGVMASGDYLFADALFGRDALVAAEDIYLLKPEIALNIILALARLQGLKDDWRSCEQPGRILHEHRYLKTLSATGVAQSVPEKSQKIFYKLAQYWNLMSPAELERASTWTVYCATDASCLYVRLIFKYCHTFGEQILENEYLDYMGNKRTLKESLVAALDWICRSLKQNPLGLLAVPITNPKLHSSQAWRDGATAYLTTDFKLIPITHTLATIEIQGLAYDALSKAANYYKSLDKKLAAKYLNYANNLQENFLKYFWIEEAKYFKSAIDISNLHLNLLLSSAPAEVLDSSIFNNLEESLRQKYLSGIIEEIFSASFYTKAGFRNRPIEYALNINYWDYQGSYTVWLKSVYEIAKGLKNNGFYKLAQHLEIILLNTINLIGEASEFVYVDLDDTPNYDNEPLPLKVAVKSNYKIINATNIPEAKQAWTITLAIAIKYLNSFPIVAGITVPNWKIELEERILRNLEAVYLYRTIEELRAVLKNAHHFYIDTKSGIKLERQFMHSHQLKSEDEATLHQISDFPVLREPVEPL